MGKKRLLFLSILLITEAIAILFFSNVKKTGLAHDLRFSPLIFYDPTVIFIVIFLLTLIALLLSIHFIRNSEKIQHKNERETNISSLYLEESIYEKKSKKEIITDLESKGYSRKEIENFLHDWERHEEDKKCKQLYDE
jgi:hypothetical protein